MNHISLKAVCLAFLAEFIADNIIDTVMLLVLAHGTLSSDVDQETFRKASEAIVNGSDFLIGKVIFGTATTVGGGYLAARLAKTFPYYNGLGMGLIGLIFCILVWGDLLWLNVFAVLSSVPLSIYGAHLAKKHMVTAK